MIKKPEVLAPGGDTDSVKAAILAGADAVYVGLSKFNARVRARNCTEDDLKSLARLAKERGVSLYLTLNVLLTDEEIPEALNMAASAVSMGIYDIIVQDTGLCMLIGAFFPSIKVHASTQMTIHNSAQARFARKLGVDRVNLARELSIAELAAVIPAVHDLSLKAEIFVHGAFCVSFSGLCYMSSFIGGNSGNRGACMQPCRKQYLVENKKRYFDADEKYSYLLSLKDNNAIDFARKLSEAGADSFKIEGRIKNYQYVYTVVKAWRNAVDWAIRKDATAPTREDATAPTREDATAPTREDATAPTMEDAQALGCVFNRGFTTGYMEGAITSEMFASSPLDQSLILLGTVKSFEARSNRLTIDGKVAFSHADGFKIGTGEIQIFSPRNAFICSGEIVKHLPANSWVIRITGKLYGKILPGYLVVRPKENLHTENLRESLDGLTARPLRLRLAVTGRENNPLRALYMVSTTAPTREDATAPTREANVESRMYLSKAREKPLTGNTLTAHLTGGSGFSGMSASVDHTGFAENLFLPLSELNRMRQEAAATLFPTPLVLTASDLPVIPGLKKRPTSVLVLLSRDIPFTVRARDTGFETAVEVSGPEDLLRLRSRSAYAPSIIMEKELEKWEKALCENPPVSIITSNTGLGLLAGEAGVTWIAGPGVNCANSYSFEALRLKAGCGGAFFSTELNRDQLAAIQVPASMKGYLTVFGPILMMTSRQALAADNTPNPHATLREYYKSIKDKAGFQFHVWRRNGWYTELYNGGILFLPEAVACFKDKIDYIVLDLRDFPFLTLSHEGKQSVIDYFAELAGGGKAAGKSLQSLLPGTTSGNFKRGLA